MTALVARIVRQLNETTTGRLSVKVSPMGVDVDIGSNKRISEVTTAGASITVGMQVRHGNARVGRVVAGFGRWLGLTVVSGRIQQCFDVVVSKGCWLIGRAGGGG